MITIQHGPVLYGISFSHPHLVAKGKKAPERATICAINQWVDAGTEELRIRGWKELTIAEVACSRSDNFNRAIGRKKALARALCQHDFGIGKHTQSMKCSKCGSSRTTTLTLPKDLRSSMWKAYWEATAPVYEAQKPAFVEGELLEYAPGLGDSK